MAEHKHIPVLLKEVLATLQPQVGAIYIDATFGAGGYSRAILESAECRVIAFDRDPSVLPLAKKFSAEFEGRFQFINEPFAQMLQALPNRLGCINGVVFDIGVSSMQIDNAERGFSFQADGPLDMRMSPAQTLDASYIVNNYEQDELADILYYYGGEKKSRLIARAIVQARQVEPIVRTAALAGIIQKAVPRYNDTINPATRSFQALRIVVNDELAQLESGLQAASKLLAVGGKLLIVNFHSLEDRISKTFCQTLCGKVAGQNRHLPDLLQPSCKPDILFKQLIKGVLTPSEAEIASNPRSRSAKLRAIWRVS